MLKIFANLAPWRSSTHASPPAGSWGVALVSALLSISGAAFVPACAVGPVSKIEAPPDAILIDPKTSIQSVVDAHPAGTTYFLARGLYRMQRIDPKNGDRFIGAAGARLNGARLLTGARRSGSVFVFDNQAPDPHISRQGVCQPGYPRCDWPLALFLDDRPLRAVGRLVDLVSWTWYFDFTARRIYVAADVTERTVELTFSPYAFGGIGRDVQIENLIIEKYASPNQRGAINDYGAGIGWKIFRNEIRLNYGYGITLASGHRAINNYVHSNGELGVGGGNSSAILVEGNEIAFNAWNGTDCDWECGGAKWGKVRDIIVRNNYVHDNRGKGLWTDEGCKDVLIEKNRIEYNMLAGIAHEISFSAIIRNNQIRGNGAATFRWGWQAQILLQNSSDTEVYNNYVELDTARGGNGITLIQQNRGTGFDVRNVMVRDNEIIMRGGNGAMAGWFVDYREDGFKYNNNHFDRNNYLIYSTALDQRRWSNNAPVSFAAWQAAGYDKTGKITVIAR